MTVWVALKESDEVTLEVLETGGVGPWHVWPKLLAGRARTWKLGDMLHVAAISTDLSANISLEPAEIYAYNLRFSRGRHLAGVGSEDALTGSLEKRVDISYFDHGLPTFVMPPFDLEKVRLAHGSCRKPHDPGRDALAILDDIIEKSQEPDATVARPHQLFLTGDQIYAEEVMDPLLWMIVDASRTLLGWAEVLPDDTHIADLLPGLREKPLREKAKLKFHSSSQLKSHIIALGEYYAMYLFAWSQVLWPDELPTYQEVSPYLSPLLGRDDSFRESAWNKERKSLLEFIEDLPGVRRVLANIPTYMIFDDHDVTDDWYISKSWCDDVLGTGWGKRLIQNALIAYAVFQHWGNVPKDFEGATSGRKLLQEIVNITDVRQASTTTAINKYLGLPPGFDDSSRWAPPFEGQVALARDSDSMVWNYVVEGPKYEVIVLDTRTWRGHVSSAPTAPPSMLSPTAFQRQLAGSLDRQGRLGIEATLVIAPTNPVGIRIIDWIQQQTAAHPSTYSKSIGWFDYGDAWNFHEVAFATLLTTLFSRRRRVVLLSGDIHFGYAVRLAYSARRPFGAPSTNAQHAEGTLAQLTSSAFKNADAIHCLTKILHTKAKQIMPERPHDWAGWNDAPELFRQSSSGWAKVSLPPDSPFVTDLAPGVLYGIRDEGRQADWRYRIEFAQRRPGPGRSRAAFVIPSHPTADNAAGWLALYYAVTIPGLTAVAPLVYDSPWFQEGVEIVGLHNVGIVSFKWPAMGKAVFQDLYYWPPGKPDSPGVSRYEVSLDVDPEPAGIPVQPVP